MERVIQKIVRRVVEQYAPEEIILFGSHAKQTHHALSDIDLLVIVDTPLPRRSRAAEIADYVQQLPVKVDIHFYTPSEIEQARSNPYSFISSIFLSGQKIYGKNICTIQAS